MGRHPSTKGSHGDGSEAQPSEEAAARATRLVVERILRVFQIHTSWALVTIAGTRFRASSIEHFALSPFVRPPQYSHCAQASAFIYDCQPKTYLQDCRDLLLRGSKSLQLMEKIMGRGLPSWCRCSSSRRNDPSTADRSADSRVRFQTKAMRLCQSQLQYLV